MTEIILIRHGQSEWNAKNKFTGWVDSDLSEKGKLEAKYAGELIKNTNIKISISYTSYLRRAQETLNIILNVIGKKENLVEKAWELNERHYGSLTGLNKEETKIKLGEETFNRYRRSWDIAPPPIEKNSQYLNKFNKQNSKIPSLKIPTTESLKNTYDRVIPYYKETVLPQIANGKNVLIAAHGNSLRAFCKYIFNISNEKINQLEIPTGNPMRIRLDSSCLKSIDAFYLDEKRKQKIFVNE
ncbi:MAG: phosphoglyceromutase [Pelagibacterales bacterium]|nr:phosphoglyceromutase [Pelagibacterales bacterium]|tara:strand:- start:1808 stop:2533 length:726 start_codon:yes stop_codon:yes gene_type:complete